MNVFRFLWVVDEVVKLNYRELLFRSLSLAWGTPAAGAAAQQQFPLAFTDGEMAAAGVMDYNLMQCFF